MKRAIFLIVCCTLTAVLAWSQATAQIHGVVQDSSGAAVPAANIKATQTETGIVRTTTSGGDGGYVITLKGQSCSPAPCVNDLNPAAFALPTLGTYGNMAMGVLRAPRFWEWDQTVSRQFKITEGQRIEIRAEAFNVTNSVRFAAPIAANLNVTSGNFGRITTSQSTTGSTTATGNSGRIMQFALKYVF